MHPQDTIQCWTNHLGIWAIESLWFQQALSLFQHGLYAPPKLAALERDDIRARAASPNNARQYDVFEKTAIIPITGPITKGESKFGGANTLSIRRDVRAAVRDNSVENILLRIDSPGGHVAGIQELADDIATAKRVKPVHAHIDDMGASAAYWAASQATSISANATGQVGSIGTMIVVTDTSKQFERIGLEAHVIATGEFKGLGVPGTKLTKEGKAYLQTMVDGINTHFLSSVLRGRRLLAPSKLAQVADGRTFLAADAMAHGLIDRVESFDSALLNMRHNSTIPTATTGVHEWLARHSIA